MPEFENFEPPKNTQGRDKRRGRKRRDPSAVHVAPHSSAPFDYRPQRRENSAAGKDGKGGRLAAPIDVEPTLEAADKWIDLKMTLKEAFEDLTSWLNGIFGIKKRRKPKGKRPRNKGKRGGRDNKAKEPARRKQDQGKKQKTGARRGAQPHGGDSPKAQRQADSPQQAAPNKRRRRGKRGGQKTGGQPGGGETNARPRSQQSQGESKNGGGRRRRGGRRNRGSGPKKSEGGQGGGSTA